MILIVAVPLGYSSLQVFETNTAEQRATDATSAWLAGSGYRFVSAKAQDDRVDVVVAGSGELPATDALASSLKGSLYGMAIHIEAVPSTEIDFATD